MSRNPIRALAALAALALLTPLIARAEQPKAGVVVVENNTGVELRIGCDYYIDAEGERAQVEGTWTVAPDESIRLVNDDSKHIVAQKFVFTIITADGQSHGWKVEDVNDDGELRINLGEKTLAAHRKEAAAAARAATTTAADPTPSDELITFKPFRGVMPGDRERVEISQSDAVRTSDPDGGSTPDSSSSSAKAVYVAEYLGGEANPYSKQIIAFEKAAHTNNGESVALNLDGKKVVAQQREGKTGFRLADGDDLGEDETAFLEQQFGGDAADNSDSGASLLHAFLPKEAVAAGQSWACDTELLAKEALSGFEGLTLDPDKSRGQATLVRVYELDGVSYARMKVEATVAIVRNESKDEVMKFNPPMLVRFSGSYDLCIDGTTANMTANLKWTASGTATVKNSDGESRLKIGVTGATFKKYTLLSKE